MSSPERPPAPADAWGQRQRAFVQRLGSTALADLDAGTIVVLPSATFPLTELRKITGIEHYEERMLFTALFLARPELRLVYLTSMPVDEAIVDYYLRFLPDPAGARRRLTMVSLDQPGPVALTEKLVGRPDVVERVRALAGPAEQAYVLPYNVTPAEGAVADALRLPMYGAHPSLAALGSKSGARRRVARKAGVAVLEGREDLHSAAEVESALEAIRDRRPKAEAAVVKLDHGFSGQGNAIVELGGPAVPLAERPTVFCAANESWPSFTAKLQAGGGIAEELVSHEAVRSPSVQVRIDPAGRRELVSTHDQILGGPQGHVYIGCRFPADPRYRAAIQDAGIRVAAVLAAEGVIGSFGIDFVIVPGGDGGDADVVTLSEINLRMGGTTHPYWMCRLVTGGTYDASRGELVAGGAAKAYVASDNLKSARLVGRTPAQVIQAVDAAGLGFDPVTRTGACLHLLGALPGFGKMGVTCIADDPAAAQALFADTVALLTG